FPTRRSSDLSSPNRRAGPGTGVAVAGTAFHPASSWCAPRRLPISRRCFPDDGNSLSSSDHAIVQVQSATPQLHTVKFRYFFRAAARFFGAGPFALFSASNSAARSTVSSSTLSLLRSDALQSQSVTYGPKRPRWRSLGLPVGGSGPGSVRGAGEACRVLRLGSA